MRCWRAASGSRAVVAVGLTRVAVLGLAPGCNSSLSAPNPTCSLNSDCSSPLVCVFQHCHSQCNTPADCAPGPARCVPGTGAGADAGVYHVCQLQAESTCTSMGCPTGESCGTDRQCRATCSASAPCSSGQCATAAGALACFDPAIPQDRAALADASPLTGVTDASTNEASPPDATIVADSADAAPGDGPAEADATPFMPNPDAGGGIEFNATNVDFSMLDAGAGDDAGVFAGAPDVRNGALPSPMLIAQNDPNATPADLYILSSWTIDPTATVTPANNGRVVIVLVRGAVDVQGRLLVNATTRSAGPGGYSGDGSNEGPGGGRPGQSIAYPKSNAGGGAYCGAGGQGAATSPPAAPGGRPYGNATLNPLIGGSSGGGRDAASPRGAGGGAIQVIAGRSITVGPYAAIHAGGGGGWSGGAGSGGAILLEAPTVTVRGALAANGGGGGSVTFASGGDSTADARPAPGYGGFGGVGSAGTTINGGDASVADGGSDIGGGGGGAGRIRINTTSGQANIASSAVISPDLTTACATQGTLN